MTAELMIPLSVVDALIAKLEKQQKESGATLQRLYKIEMLQQIKKEAISIPIPTQQSIPMSVIDALIVDFQTNGYRNNYDTKDVRDILEMIKKEATFVQSPIEQKIKDRITELEKELNYQMDNGRYQTETTALLILKLDELRKLLK